MNTVVQGRTQDRTPRALGVARRAALVFALWLGFWLLALALIALLLSVPYAQLRYAGELGLGGMLAVLAAISLAIALFRPRARNAGARDEPLPRARVPALYALVEDIGARAGIRAPVAIHLGLGVNASIGATRTWNGRVRKLDVVLGHGLLGVLDERGLSAVIAHEYGHMAKGDLGLTPWVYRTRASLVETVSSLESSLFLLDAPFRLYAHAFLSQSARISRAQEYAADALGATLFGADAMADALRAVHAATPEWDAYQQFALLPAVNRGARLPVLDGFRRFLAASRRRAAVLDAIARGRAAPPHPYDSHPAFEERLAALGTQAHAAPPAAHALHLLGGEDQADALWYERFTRGALQATSWDEYGEQVLAPSVQARFRDTFLAPDRVSLSALPALVADTDALWERTKPDGVVLLSAQGRARHVLAVLEEFAMACLGRSGWRMRVVPGEPVWMERDGAWITPEQLIAEVREGRRSAAELSAISADVH
jgi:Zn-dependent protease with chaperone function